MRSLRFSLAFGMAILLGARSVGAAPDGSEGWTAALERLAGAVAEQRADAATLTQQCRVTRLDGPETSIRELLAVSGGASWRQTLAYSRVPDELAGDLAAALALAPAQQALKKYLLPIDESQRRRADALAAKWVATVLEPRQDQPIGLILLYRESPDARTAGTLLVILATAEPAGSAEFRFHKLAFGQFQVPAR